MLPWLFKDLNFYLKRFSFDNEGFSTPCMSRKKRISKTPSHVFKHPRTESTKRMQNDILVAKTKKDAASDDTNGMAFLPVLYMLNPSVTRVVLIKRVSVTSNKTDIFSANFVLTPCVWPSRTLNAQEPHREASSMLNYRNGAFQRYQNLAARNFSRVRPLTWVWRLHYYQIRFCLG